MNLNDFPTFSDLFPGEEDFQFWCEQYDVVFDSEVYAHLYIKYASSNLRYLSEEVAISKIMRILSVNVPAYIRQRDAVKALYEQTLDAASQGLIQVSNVSANDNERNQSNSFEILNYVGTQQSSLVKSGEFDALIKQYKNVFSAYVDSLVESIAGLFRQLLTETEEGYIYGNF